MTRNQYRAARALLRANGNSACKWLPMDQHETMWALCCIALQTDTLAERAHFQLTGDTPAMAFRLTTTHWEHNHASTL